MRGVSPRSKCHSVLIQSRKHLEIRHRVTHHSHSCKSCHPSSASSTRNPGTGGTWATLFNIILALWHSSCYCRVIIHHPLCQQLQKCELCTSHEDHQRSLFSDWASRQNANGFLRTFCRDVKQCGAPNLSDGDVVLASVLSNDTK